MVDVSFIADIIPIVAFLLVAFVVSALLVKFEILGKNSWVIVIVALSIGLIFLNAANAQKYLTTVVPWFALLIISLMFILILVSMVGKPAEGMHKGIGIVFVILAAIIVVLSGLQVFSGEISIPDWFKSSQAIGGGLLLLVAIILAIVVGRVKK